MMPRSKHHTKKEAASTRRKAKNIRKAIAQYVGEKKRKQEKFTRTNEWQTEKFNRVFPTR